MPRAAARPKSPMLESRFQSRIIECARHNGWRIDIEDTYQDRYPHVFYALCQRFTKLEHITKKLRDFLFGRRSGDFLLAYHTHNSERSAPGFPDLVLVHPRKRKIIFAELKRDGEYPTTEQRLWLAALSTIEEACPHNVTVALWRPADWPEIVHELGGFDPRFFV